MTAQLLFGVDGVVCRWVEKHLHHTKFDDTARGIGLLKGDKIVAGAVYSDYRQAYGDITFSFASDGSKHWANRKAIAAWYYYPFMTLGCRRLTAHVKKGNKKAIHALTNHLNFRYEGCIRELFPDGKGAIIFGLLRRDIPAWLYDYGVTPS
jgi:RimJ/RimL family protein N-acetyltransferase